MFEAYKVAVKIALHDGVTRGLVQLSGEFKKTAAAADMLQKKMDAIKKITLTGIGIGAGGIFGLKALDSSLKVSEEYAHQLNIMNMAGLKHVEIAQAIAAAWKTTGSVITSTATGNLKAFMDLRNVFGSTSEAIQYMPELVRLQAVLKSSTESSVSQNAEQLAYSVAKALDIRGAVNNPAEFNKQAEMMGKVIVAMQGRVLPQDYQMLFKYGRQAIPSLSDTFLYQELPTLMQEMKGSGGGGSSGGFGTSLTAFYRFFVQGIMTKAALQGMQSLGIISRNAGLRTSTVGTQLMGGQHVLDVGLAQTDQFQWVQQVLLPAIRRHYGNNLNKQQLSLAITDAMRGASQTAIFGVLQYALKAQQIYRDQRLIEQAKNPTQAYQMALSNDPTINRMALGAQWENLKTSFTLSLVPILLPVIMTLAKGFNYLAEKMREYPKLTKVIAVGFAGLAVTMTGVGALLIGAAGVMGITAAFKILRISLIAITAPFTEIIGIIAAVSLAVYGAIKAFKTLEPLISKYFHSSTPGTAQQPHKPTDNFFIHSGQKPVTVHNNVWLDGKSIYQGVSNYQAKVAARQPAHGSVFDPSMSLQPNMLNISP